MERQTSVESSHQIIKGRIGLDEDMQVSEPMNIIYQTAEDGL